MAWVAQINLKRGRAGARSCSEQLGKMVVPVAHRGLELDVARSSVGVSLRVIGQDECAGAGEPAMAGLRRVR
jgi:hypothetical protein